MLGYLRLPQPQGEVKEETNLSETEEQEHQKTNDIIMSKVCFVTTGATAEFSELIAAVLDPQCLQLLKKEGFTTLNIQCGETFKNVESMKPADTQGLAIHAFDFKPDLHRDMRECQALEGPGCSRKQGLIILHAGAGTVMDAMRLGLNMIVVPNPSLLDNHQDELAEELHMQNYATAASVHELTKGIRRACAWQAKPWAPPTCQLKTFVDEVLGYNEDGTPQYSTTHRLLQFKTVKQVELLQVEEEEGL